MRARGNGEPGVCALNLLSCVRGEVPYERLKGLDPRLIDQPLTDAKAKLQRGVDWLVGTYEPRMSAGSIVIAPGQNNKER